MKHRKTGRQFGRVRRQRTALIRTMLGSLILHGRIVTTEAKAKELHMRIDRIITKVKRAMQSGDNAKHAMIRKVEKDIPLVAVKKLIADMDRFSDRNSGYTRVVKMVARTSDNAKMAIIEFV
jgi:large subunit ribosomal protein L17